MDLDWNRNLPGTDAGPSECLDAAYERYQHLAPMELRALRDFWQTVEEEGKENEETIRPQIMGLQAQYIASACDALLRARRHGWKVDKIRSAHALPEYAELARRKLKFEPDATAGDAYRHVAKETADTDINGHEEEERVRRAFNRWGFGGNDLSPDERRNRLDEFCFVATALRSD